MAKTKTTKVVKQKDATPSTPAPSETAPTQTQPQGVITIQDLQSVVTLIKDLDAMKRLSTAEVSYVTPAYQSITAFLDLFIKQQEAEKLKQTQNELLDLGKK